MRGEQDIQRRPRKARVSEAAAGELGVLQIAERRAGLIEHLGRFVEQYQMLIRCSSRGPCLSEGA